MSVHNQFTASSGNHSNNSNAGGGGFSISEHVLMAKQEKANGGAYCSETKYSDGFNDFGLFYGSGKPGSASEINGWQKSGDVFMSEPVNGGGLYGSGNDGDSKDSGVAGYDVAGGDDFDFDIDADIDSDIQSEDTLPEDGTVGHAGFFDFFNDFDGRNEPEKKKSDTLFSEQEFGDDVFFDDSAGYGGKEDGEEEHDDQDDESYFDDDEFFEKEFGDKKKNIRMILIICGIAAAVILLLVISINFTISSIIGKGTVYDGVLINGHNLSGMTKDEVAAYVKKTYFDPIAEAKVTIRLGETAETYSLINFVVCPDENEIAEEAYSVARTGKKLDRVNEILELKSNPKLIAIEYQIVDDKLEEIVKSATDISFSVPVNPTYEIRDNVVVFTSGKNGTSIDISKFRSDLYNMLGEFEDNIKQMGDTAEMPNTEILIDTTIVEFISLKAPEIYEKASVAPVDAYYYRDGASKKSQIKIADHVAGKSLDAEKLNDIVRRINYGENIPYAELPYVYTNPAVTSDLLKEKLFSDTINQTRSVNKEDSYSVSGWVGVEERSVNMQKAANAFGQVMLLSGESISFFEAVGAVNSRSNYVQAYENVENGGIKIVGGGISQVASALYTAAVKSGLEISLHYNNTYYPNYGLIGFDAYVSSDEDRDLVIKNTRDYPVSVKIEYSDNIITVTVDATDNGASAVSLSVVELSAKVEPDGVKYTYDIYKSQGYAKTPLGTVTYLRVGELLPGTETPDITYTPDNSATAGESPSSTPDLSTEDPSATPDAGSTPDGSEAPDSQSPDTSQTPDTSVSPAAPTYTPDAPATQPAEQTLEPNNTAAGG